MAYNPSASWSSGTDGLVLLLARLLLAWVYLDSGIAKLTHWQDGLAEVAGLGLPAPALMLTLTVVTQLVAGLAIAIGYGARLGALALIGFTLFATVLAHNYWAYEGVDRIRQKITFFEHMAIIGGFLVLVARGPGPWSIEALRRRASTRGTGA